MFKNVASQKLIVFAFDSTTNLPKSGDAANITAYVSKDYGAVTVLGDTSATEMDSTNAKGYYLFDLTQSETNADTLLFSAKSSTANIVVIGVPAVVFTLPTTGLLAPTTSGRTLDVSAGGEAGLDWANIGSPTTSVSLSGTSTKALEPTVAGRTLDVSAGGEAGLDWANIGSPTTTVNLSGTSTKSLQPTVAGRTLDVTATGAAGIDWGNVENQSTNVSLSQTLVATVTTTNGFGSAAILTTELAITYGPVTAAAATTVTFTPQKDTAAAALVGAVVTIYFDDGDGARLGQPRVVVSAVDSGSDIVLTVDRAWDSNPSTSGPDKVAVWSFGSADLRAWRGTQPSTLTSGRVEALVGALASGIDTTIATAVMASTIETGVTLTQAVRWIGATTAGKLSGSQTSTEVFKGLDGTTTRVTVTADVSGNRTNVVYV